MENDGAVIFEPSRTVAPMIRAMADQVRDVIAAAHSHAVPFPHWTLSQLLPPGTARRVRALALPEEVSGAADGRRASRNGARFFANPAVRCRSPVLREIGDVFQEPATVQTLAALCGTDLSGSLLRIEQCRDTNGFWLEPHTDIGAKRLTLILSLSTGPGSEAWGTDLLFADGSLAIRRPAIENDALLFLPAADTWHGLPVHSQFT